MSSRSTDYLSAWLETAENDKGVLFRRVLLRRRAAQPARVGKRRARVEDNVLHRAAAGHDGLSGAHGLDSWLARLDRRAITVIYRRALRRALQATYSWGVGGRVCWLPRRSVGV